MTETRTPQSKQAQAPAQSDGLFVDVLCAVDGTRRSYAAVEQAAILAGPEARMTLLAVTAVAGSGVNKHAAISPRRAERILERAESIARGAGVECTGVIEPEGPPSQQVLEHAAGRDLLALGAPATSWLGGRFIESVADGALDSLAAPLLSARALPAGAHRFPERILVASDGLDGSDELVDWVARVAGEHGASVTLLHTIGKESSARPHRIQEQASRLEQAIDGACEARVEVGAAAELIIAAAKRDASSLVVMGSRRLGGLRAIGSVSRRVVHKAHCSVLLVPPDWLLG